jgi:hypothetical protein
MNQNTKKHPDHIIRSLMKIDSSIRSGQFLYAHRESNKLLAELMRKEYDIEENMIGEITSSIKRTILFLHPVIAAYAQNQASLDIARKYAKCKKTKINP